MSGIAKDLGISESCLRHWVSQADVDRGRKEGLSSDECAELVRLRRELRVRDMEIEILTRASAFVARENVLPKSRSGWSESLPRRHRRRGGLPGARGVTLGLLRVA